MKGGIYLVYTSLLTISVLSSCALFILVVCEASTAGAPADGSGLGNVTERRGPPAPPEPPAGPDLTRAPQDELDQSTLNQLAYAEGLSQNSVVANGLPDTGQPPVQLSLGNTVQLELQSGENLSTFGDPPVANDTVTLVKNDSTGEQIVSEPTEPENESSKAPEPLVVQAKPIQEVRLAEEAFKATSTTPPPSQMDEADVDNKTENVQKDEPPHEDIPSFSEWAQKQLAEAEKQDTVQNHSSQPSHSINNVNSKNSKVRSKNYASPACGAKVVAVNPEAGSASSILSPNRDEYMLNTCNSRIWFTVELCEPIQAQKIELANFELFSSSPKDFIVYFSDRFPTREWTSVGQFTAKNDKEIQSFDLFPHLFGKFIKVEMLSHYGSEHYCPISLFKVYGTSEFEVLEKENAEHLDAPIEDDEILGDLPDVPISDDAEVSQNLFGSARDAVMSIMKKAAQVLVKSDSSKNSTDRNNENNTSDSYEKCCSPSHIIVCDNCSAALFSDVYDLISCHSKKLMKTMKTTFMRETLRNTEICQRFGLDFRNKRTISFRNERAIYLSAMLSENYIAALCNLMAIIDKKVVLNSSHETELNVTSNLTLDKMSNKVVDENNLNEILQMPFKEYSTSEQKESPKVDEKFPSISEATVIMEEVKENIPSPVNLPDPPVPQLTVNEIPKVKTAEPKIEKCEDKDAQSKDNIAENVPTAEKQEALPTTEASNAESKTPNEKDIKVDNSATDAGTIPSDKRQTYYITDDVPEPIIIETESFLSELDTLISDATVQPMSAPNVANNQPPQKESVFLRLSNRVKTLERNMSLSAQYLEELSRRYKKQVEEMQKSFDKTILQLNEERRRTEERDQYNLQQLAKLEQQLSQLQNLMKDYAQDHTSWFGTVTLFRFLLLQAITVALVIYYFKRKAAEQTPTQPTRKTQKSRKSQKLRRKSVEGVSGHELATGKRRRPSEEAMHIARLSAEEIDDDEGDWVVAKKNRRRKTSVVHRSEDWSQDPLLLSENAIPLDEEEHIAPVSEPKRFTEPPKEPKTNGILHNLKKQKSRRLSSPAFFRAALGRQSAREAGGSRSPAPSARSDLSAALENGSAGEGRRDKRRSFKSIFRKVF